MDISHPQLLPIIAIIFGLIILIFPKFLNYILGIYLVFIGLIGLIQFFKDAQ